MTRIGSLCSGYGGLEMGVQLAAGGTVAWHADNDKGASRILAHHWPDVPNHGDITAVDWSTVEPVDWLCAGYPCQPFSVAGKRNGVTDDRHIWPDVARAIGVLRPRWVVLENVAGHVTMGLGAVVGDLAGMGYDAAWGVVRASDVGAPHIRARVFVAATDTRSVRRDGRAGVLGDGGHADVGGETVRDVGDRAAPSVAPDAEGELRHGPRVPRRRWPGPTNSGDHATPDPVRDPLRQQSVRFPGGGRAPVTGHPRGERRPWWGAYAPAIARWERVHGRPAPVPNEPGTRGQPRLSPAFTEWLMGLPAGHVTAVPALSRNAQLQALGNGVVPLQAGTAVAALLAVHARNPDTERENA